MFKNNKFSLFRGPKKRKFTSPLPNAIVFVRHYELFTTSFISPARERCQRQKNEDGSKNEMRVGN